MKSLKVFKILRTIIGIISIISVPLLFFTSCVGGVASAIFSSCAGNSSEESSFDLPIYLSIVILACGIITLVAGKYVYTKLILLLLYIVLGIVFLLNINEFDLLICYGISCLIIGVYFIIEFVFTILHNKYKTDVNH